jgi:hypothetical protein
MMAVELQPESEVGLQQWEGEGDTTGTTLSA